MDLLIGMEVEFCHEDLPDNSMQGKKGIVLKTFPYGENNKWLMLCVLVDGKITIWDSEYASATPDEILRINQKRKEIIEKVNRFEIIDIKED